MRGGIVAPWCCNATSHIKLAHYQRPAVQRTLNIYTAINTDSLSGHIVSLADDIAHTSCNFFGGTETGHGDFFENALADVLRHLPKHIRLREAWADSVNCDAMTGHL